MTAACVGFRVYRAVLIFTYRLAQSNENPSEKPEIMIKHCQISGFVADLTPQSGQNSERRGTGHSNPVIVGIRSRRYLRAVV
jgi:hypothetical protein